MTYTLPDDVLAAMITENLMLRHAIDRVLKVCTDRQGDDDGFVRDVFHAITGVGGPGV